MTVSLGAMAAGQFLLMLGSDDRYFPFALVSLMITLSLVPVALTEVTAPEVHPTSAFGARKLYATSPLGFMGMLISGLANGAFWGLGAVFAQRYGLSAVQIASFMASIIVGGALLQRPIGYFSDKFDRRRILRTVAFLAATAALLLLLATRLWVPVLFPVSFLYGGFAFAVYSLSVAHTNDHLASEQILEATRGLLLVFGIGAVIGPFIAGVFMNLFEGGLIVYFLINWLALGGFAVYRELQSAPIPMDEQSRFELMRTSPVALELYPPTQQDTAQTSAERSNESPGRTPR
jgi:MFS family permease